MPIPKCLIVALTFVVLSPLAASAMTSQQAYAQCRARYASYPETPGSGNPQKEMIIEGCAQQLMSQQGNQPQRARQKEKSGSPANR